jgi:hypothetical protein
MRRTSVRREGTRTASPTHHKSTLESNRSSHLCFRDLPLVQRLLVCLLQLLAPLSTLVEAGMQLPLLVVLQPLLRLVRSDE